MTASGAPGAVSAWEARGSRRQLCGQDIFTVDVSPHGPEEREPLLCLHGFPTCSFDFHLVVDLLAVNRRVLLVDFLGYGLSAKPDQHYTVAGQADLVVAYTDLLGVDALSLLTHDLGDTVGGELLARQAEGIWPVEIVRRVLSNGSIYIDMAQLSAGQQLLLAMADQRAPEDLPIDQDTLSAALAATFSPRSTVASEELASAWDFVARDDGHRLLPRLIRYIDERRRSERRFTGAIESHPSPLSAVWGADDPIAVVAMTDRLGAARPSCTCTVLADVGHYPMLESPQRFVAAVQEGLA